MCLRLSTNSKKLLPHEIDIRILFLRIRYDFEMHAS